MAQKTDRSPNGVMGKTYNTFSGFTAKTPAVPSAAVSDYIIRIRRRRSQHG